MENIREMKVHVRLQTLSKSGCVKCVVLLAYNILKRRKVAVQYDVDICRLAKLVIKIDFSEHAPYTPNVIG